MFIAISVGLLTVDIVVYPFQTSKIRIIQSVADGIEIYFQSMTYFT